MVFKKKKKKVEQPVEVEEEFDESEFEEKEEEDDEEPPVPTTVAKKKVVQKNVWTLEQIPTEMTTVIKNNRTGKTYDATNALVHILNQLED